MYIYYGIVGYRVSIPHRYGKNPLITEKDGNVSAVSIPHRYGKNLRRALVLSYIFGFPFLIGTVRTVLPAEVNNCGTKFPFLIGTVRTFVSSEFTSEYQEFPFLIGTVRTKMLVPVSTSADIGFHSS